MDVVEVLKTRRSAKVFNPNRELAEAEICAIEDILRYAPSSVNLQPWHFVIASSAEGKARMAKGAHGMFEANKERVLHASANILFATHTEVCDEQIYKVWDKETADGRYLTEEFRQEGIQSNMMFANVHRDVFCDGAEWAERQVYINLGNFLLGVACLGLDAVALEGLDFSVLDEEFNLTARGLKAVMLVSVGESDLEDYNAKLPKSRLEKQDIIERL